MSHNGRWLTGHSEDRRHPPSVSGSHEQQIVHLHPIRADRLRAMVLRLSHHQHACLVRLLECELTGAWRAALGAGADPEELRANLARRQRLIEASMDTRPDARADGSP